MADKSISELVAVTSIQAADLFVCEQNGTAKKVTGQIFENWLTSFADGHGGIQSITYTAPVSPSLTGSMVITMADTTTATVSVTNGRGITGITWTTSGTAGNGQTHTGTIAYNDGTTSTVVFKDGLKGDPGPSTYVWIKYSANEPTSSTDMSDFPSNWMGIYVGTESTAPQSYSSYQWYKIKGETGAESTVTTFNVRYKQGASGSTEPTGEWSPTIPTVAQGGYLWTKTTIAFNNGTPIEMLTSAYQGVDGQGVPATETPLGDVENGAVGTSTAYAREDHQHPISLPYELSTSGEWTIRKWDDGTLECWCVHNFDLSSHPNTDVMTQWSSGIQWYYYEYGSLQYPVTFISTPICTYTQMSVVSGTTWLYTRVTGSTTQTPSIAAGRPTTAQVNQIGGNIGFYAIGRWKA